MRHSVIIIFLTILISCTTKTRVDGVQIGNTLHEQQDFSTNIRFAELIHQSLNRNTEAFAELLRFPCGGAAGCYDLGSVITQIVYKVGEQNFSEMIKNFSKEQKHDIRNYLEVGLEYGYRVEKSAPNKTVDQQFPFLNKMLVH
ncbi:MAG: hypothetical protein ACM3H8_09540 [Sphingobacteriales bacterium]